MKSSLYRIAALSAAALLLAGCANQRAPKESGFLGDYSQLREEQVPGGARLIYRRASSAITRSCARSRCPAARG
ncbi:PF11769 domain protein [Bordetella pertussis STO1-CHOC-0018]|nr:PF11769 domain protein [Bordetella pertussis STO1-CHOC-0018]